LSRRPAFKLAGVISGVSSFKHVNPPMIVDDSGLKLFSPRRWDIPAGTFEFPELPAGTYRLRVSGLNGNQQSTHDETISLDKDLIDLNFSLEAGVTIPVIVRAELGPKPGPHFCSGSLSSQQGESVDCSRLPLMMGLQPIETGRSGVGAQPVSKDDPSLVFSGVTPGTYLVRVTPMMAAYVASLRCGGVDLFRDPLIVPERGQVPPIEVVLRDDGGLVSVHVRSDKPARNGRILLVPEFAPNLPPIDLDIGAAGDREFGGLAPGSYKVFALDSLDEIEYENPEVMAEYNSKAATVDVTVNGRATVSVDLIHAGGAN
jgi:hypothetical protein